MQSIAYISSSPLWLAAGASEKALYSLVEQFNCDAYSVRLEFDHDSSYRLEMETQDVYQGSVSEALDRFCKDVGPLLAQPVEVLLRVDEMNDDRDRYFYAAADASSLDAFKANCRIGRAIECLRHEDFAARAALQQLLGEPHSPRTPERPRA